MLDTHADTIAVWVALSLVSIAVLTIVTQLPTTAPPDAAAAATTVDEVTTSPPGSVATRELTATEWSLTSRQIGLRSSGGTVHATFLYPIVPAFDSRLTMVLDGRSPSVLFLTPNAFERATERARTTHERWRPAPDRMTVRYVTWGGIDVTLVG